MATIQKPDTTHQTQGETFALLANGSGGAWVIDVDEAVDGAQWRAQIEGPSISLDFAIGSLDVFDKLARFLGSVSSTSKLSSGSAKRGDSLHLGGNERTPVRLVKDDEYDDRFFLIVGKPEDVIAWFTISGKDVSEIADAAMQVKEELDDE
jgi:hypothetical protein